MADEGKMTYTSEDARQAALAQLPEGPPPGTTDFKGWERDIQGQKDRILGAEIAAPAPQQQPPAPQEVGSPAPAQTPAPAGNYAPAPAPAAPAPAAPVVPSANGDEVVFTYPDGSVLKRSELHPDLQKYKDPRQIVEQFAHARSYAQRVEKTMQMTGSQLEERDKRISQLEQQLAQLNKSAEAPRPQPGEPQGQPSTRDPKRIAALREKVRDLQSLDFNSVVEDNKKFKQVTETIASVADALEDVGGSATELAVLRQQIAEQGRVLKEVASRNDETIGAIRQQEQLASLNKQFSEFQSRRPELQTSKPVFDTDALRPSVERDAARFADSFLQRKGTVMVGATPEQKWAARNRVINSFLRGDPETVSFCEANGVTPDRFDLKGTDLQNYAVMLNVNHMLNGMMVNELTGQLVPVTNYRGEPVRLPDPDTAYDYLARVSGITQRRREEELRSAEIQGQTKLENAIQRIPTPTIGRDGASPRPTAGQSMTQQDALKIMASIEPEDMDAAGRRGDWGPYHTFVKCQEIIGVPPENRWKPDRNWKPEAVRA